MSDWQPIETAPRDGTHILVFENITETILEGYWYLSGWKHTVPNLGQAKPIGIVTHWQPLPEPPK